MIGKWSVEGFKSIGDKADLEFAPLTIFAGQNSAGKSTVIQSILLTAQTLQSTVTSRSVILNGRILRLGSFSDIKSHATTEGSIAISFTLQFSPFGEVKGPLVRSIARYYYSDEYQRLMKSVGCSFTFSAGLDEEAQELQLQPRLEKAEIAFRPEESAKAEPAIFSFYRGKEPVAERLSRLKVTPSNVRVPDIAALDFVTERELPVASRYAAIPRDAKTAGIVLRHFLPSAVAAAYDAVEVEVNAVFDILVDSDSRYAYHQPSSTQKEILSPVADIFKECVLAASADLSSAYTKNRIAQSISSPLTFEAIRAVQAALGAPGRKALAANVNARESELRTLLRQGRPARMEISAFPVPETVSFAADYVNNFFSERLKYLGPLRDEPKAIYPLSGYNDPKDVGFRGEFTAAVLDNNRRAQVTYLPSSLFPYSTRSSILPTSAALEVAVMDWLQYIGIADNLATEDKGKFGHELRISTSQGDKLHDLTHVGVGVSQALPIVVLSLLAQPGSTLIFEQPELHLNPRVQTRLADFFVSLMLTGKQCIIETHSEYFISRLRYIAAMAQDVPIAKALKIYFVEKASDQSTYKDIEISETGTIKNWPVGFFDETERNSAAIIQAQLAKGRSRVRLSRKGEQRDG